MSTAQHFTIAVERPEELFTAPAIDPLAGRFAGRSGLDRLVDELELARVINRRRPFSIAVELAEPAADPAAVTGAIRGYYRSLAAETHEEQRLLRQRGFVALRLGLGVLAICLVISTAVTNAAILPDFVRRLIGESLGIAGWVVLWRPLELLLFDAWPLRHRTRLYAAIAEAPIEVRTA